MFNSYEMELYSAYTGYKLEKVCHIFEVILKGIQCKVKYKVFLSTLYKVIGTLQGNRVSV
jgi:hypothetical protein